MSEIQTKSLDENTSITIQETRQISEKTKQQVETLRQEIEQALTEINNELSASSDAEANEALKKLVQEALQGTSQETYEKALRISKKLYNLLLKTSRTLHRTLHETHQLKLISKKEAACKYFIRKYSKNFNGSLKDSEVIAIINATQGLHISRNTYYKYKSQLITDN